MSDTLVKTFIRPVWKAAVYSVAALIVLWCGLFLYGQWKIGFDFPYQPWVSDGYCNVAVVPLMGDIGFGVPMMGAEEDASATFFPSVDADMAVSMIRAAEMDPLVQGIMVRINSYGGTPVASALIKDALAETTKPTLALILEAGTSGAYMAALGADAIMAHPFSDVGSIGITSSYVDNVERNEREGLSFIELSSGKFKDSGNPDRPLTKEEVALWKRDLAHYHAIFVDMVVTARALPKAAVEVLADGSALPAAFAKEKGLIDEIGNEAAARAWFAERLGEDVIVCGE